MKTCTVGLAAGLVLWAAGAAGDDGKEKWRVAENNGVVAVYAGKTAPEKRELVFELKEMKFYSNQRLYGCIFVNGAAPNHHEPPQDQPGFFRKGAGTCRAVQQTVQQCRQNLLAGRLGGAHRRVASGLPRRGRPSTHP